MMPGMDGFAVCTALRSERVTAHIPILMVTALADDGTRERGILSGADDFLSKPYDRWELRARLGTLMLERANAEGRPPEHYGLCVHAGHVPSGWPVAELRPGTFDTPMSALR